MILLFGFLKHSEDSVHSESEQSTAHHDHDRDFLTNPYWIEDPSLKKGEVDFLSNSEITFWKDLIDKYLYPIDQDKTEQVIFCVTKKIQMILFIALNLVYKLLCGLQVSKGSSK